MKKVTVVDYGVGNLLSVRRAFECFGAEVEITSDGRRIEQADRVVLPGVGAFKNGMDGLRQRGLIVPILRFAELERPFLGICLGMQMMLESSEEFGSHKGLGLIPGKVIMIPTQGEDGKRQKIPFIGWNPLVLPPCRKNWKGTLLRNTLPGDYFYFVHSFAVDPAREEHRLADCDYNGVRISASIIRGALVGCQFHPEKSGQVGLKVIRNFLC